MSPKNMEKKEKNVSEQKTVSCLTFVMPKINSVRAAKRSWMELEKSGVDLEEVAEYLFLYASGTPVQLGDALSMGRRFKDRFPPAVDQLRTAAATVERMIKDLRNFGCAIHGGHYEKLPTNLREFADLLGEIGSAFNKSIAPGARIQKDGTIEGGRSQHLSILVSLVEEVSHEPYILIAPLVTAVRGDADRNYVRLADALRNAVARYRRDAWGANWRQVQT